MSQEHFQGIKRRERISLAREWDWTTVTILAGQSQSGYIDVRMAAGIAVAIDPSMTNTHLVVLASHEPAGVYRRVRDKDNTLLLVAATAGAIIVLPAEVFPLGYIKLGSADSSGNLQAVAANRIFTVHMKP